MRRWLVVLLLLCAVRASAQTVTVRATDPDTGTSTNVGDSVNKSFRITCVIGCSSTPPATDRSVFTVGTSPIGVFGGLFDDTPPAVLTTGMAGAARVTARRAVHMNLRTATGTEIGISGAPLIVAPEGGAFEVTGTFWQATQPVSLASVPSHAVTNAGTFAVQAAQSGTWTVQPGNTANTTAWLVTGTGGVFPASQSGVWDIRNITGTITLPTLAATSTKQSDGSQKTQLVDGSGNVITAGDVNNASAIAGALNTAPVARYDSTQPTLTSGRWNLFQVDSRGSLLIAKGAGGFTIDNTSFAVTNAGTFATQSAITAASGAIASGAIASGAIASGAVASGAFASGSIASGAVASGAVAAGAVVSGAYVSGSISDGAVVTLGAKTDAKSTATDATSVSVMQVLKEISAMAQSPAALPNNQSVNVGQVAGGSTALAGDVNNATAITNTLDVAPVARYDSTQPTLTSGRWNLFQVDSRGSLFIAKGVSGFSIDNTSFAATQSGTWSVRAQDGAGNALTSNSTTFSSKFALDANLLGTLGTAFSTAGKVDVKGADGDVFVRQTTASNLHTAATLDAETTKVIGTVRVLGNGGATVDSTVGAGTAPANAVVGGALYNSTEISPTTGQAFALQADSKGRIRGVLMDAAGNTRGANVNASNQLLTTDSASSATGSAVPANAAYTGGINHSGNLVGNVVCDQQAIYDASTSGSTQLVAISGSTHIYICGWRIHVGGTATNVKFTAGTGSNCGSAASGTPSTGTSGANAGLTPAFQFAANGGDAYALPLGTVIDSGSANAVCINASAGNAVQALLLYSQR